MFGSGKLCEPYDFVINEGSFLAEHHSVASCTVEEMRPTGEVAGPGWRLTAPKQSCNDACAASGLVCHRGDSHARNSEVDTIPKMRKVVRALGARCRTYNTEW